MNKYNISSKTLHKRTRGNTSIKIWQFNKI